MKVSDTIAMINSEILDLEKRDSDAPGRISDGYHTFDELYHHRALLFATICNMNPDIAWKSKKHHDGSMYPNNFIVGITTAEGSATYHYNMKYWNHYRVKEIPNAPEFDGHTPTIAVERIFNLSGVKYDGKYQEVECSFGKAIDACKRGAKIYRKGWDSFTYPAYVLFINREFIMHTPTGDKIAFEPSQSALKCVDWIIDWSNLYEHVENS